MKGRLTDTAIRKALDSCQSEGVREVWVWDVDLPGFGARVSAAQATFVVKYRIGGGRTARQRKFKLGRFGPLNSVQARSLAKSVLRRVARGEDPAGERDQLRNDPLVSELLDRFLQHHAEAKRRPRTAAEYRRLVERIIRPELGRLRISSLASADVSRLHQDLSSTPYQANRVLAVVSKFANWAEANGYRPKFSNPARGIEKYGERGRERYLSAGEIERLGKTLAGSQEWPTAVAAIRLLIFTGARHTEITTLRWDQVDMERGIARLGEAKSGARNIQLPAPALRVLADLPRLENNPFVIWGRRKGGHLVGLQTVWERIRAEAGLPDVRIHDLRHTVGSIGVQGGASLRLIGAVLGHKSVLTSGRYAHMADDPAMALAEKVSGQIDALMRKGADL